MRVVAGAGPRVDQEGLAGREAVVMERRGALTESLERRIEVVVGVAVLPVVVRLAATAARASLWCGIFHEFRGSPG